MLIEVVEPSDLIIPAAVAPGSPYLMRAHVPEPSRLLLIHAGAFCRAMLREPLLAQEMIGSLAGQSRRLAPQVENLKLRTRTERAGVISWLCPNGKTRRTKLFCHTERSLPSSE